MKQRIRPALGLKIRTAKHQFILLPLAALSLFILGFITIPYVEATFRASATGSDTSLVSAEVSDAWARLSTSGDVAMVAENPSVDGTIVSGRANVIVATSAPSGYKLYLSTADTTSLVNTEIANAEITSLPSSAINTFSDFNTWGYGLKGQDVIAGFSSSYSGDLSEKVFKGVTATARADDGLIAESVEARSEGVITDIYYAAYISASTPNGTYSTDVVYTLVADFVPGISDPSEPTPSVPGDDYAYTDNGHTYYYGDNAGSYYYYDGDQKVITALGVNKTEDDTITTIANINDGSITWAAIAIVAGASATFLAIALLRDRDDEDEEQQ